MCFGHLQSFFIGENIKKLFCLESEIFWGIWFLDPIDGSDIYGEFFETFESFEEVEDTTRWYKKAKIHFKIFLL